MFFHVAGTPQSHHVKVACHIISFAENYHDGSATTTAVTDMYYCWGQCFNTCLRSSKGGGTGLVERVECGTECFASPCVISSGIPSFDRCYSHCATTSCLHLYNNGKAWEACVGQCPGSCKKEP
ncbi:hypothetical protein Dimus_010377 [Dionaea muscipula]